MTRKEKARKVRFLRALAASEKSQAAWAREQGISPAHLSLVLNGHRESISLTQRIEQFANEHIGDGACALAS